MERIKKDSMKGQGVDERRRRLIKAGSALFAASGVAACGGGGENGGSVTAPPVAPPIPSPPVPAPPSPAPTPPPPAPPAPPPSGSATLTWTPPTLNSDGSAATDLTGFRIYFGTNAANLTQSVDVAGATVTSHVITGLSLGTYYFAVVAINSLGVLSNRTNVVSKVIT